MNFEFYRIFVSQLEAPNLLTEVQTKHEAFLKAFSGMSDPIYFSVDRNSYVFVEEKREEGLYIYGRIGKRASVTRHLPPEREFSTEELEDWPTVPVFVNLTDNEVRGQSIAIGISQKVALKPIKILNAFINELERRVLSDEYALNINPVTRRRDFWDVIKSNKGAIEEVTFSFITPNLFRSSDKMDEELKYANELMGAQNIDIKLENRGNGLNLSEDQPFAKRAVEYVTDGGGSYTIRVKGMKKAVKNGESVKSMQIEEFEVRNLKNDDSQIEQICNKIFACLDSLE